MKAVVCLRIAAVLMLLFAAGHTYGFLSFRPTSAEGLAVWDSMNGVHFSEHGSTFSYGEFYKGFGLSITAFQLFGAWLAWMLGNMAKDGISEARTLAWAMFTLQLIGLGLSLRYFAVGPALLSVLTALCFLVSASLMRRAAASS